MTESPTDPCANCGHYRIWHYVTGTCFFPLAASPIVNRDGETIGYLNQIDTCDGFVEPKEAP